MKRLELIILAMVSAAFLGAAATCHSEKQANRQAKHEAATQAAQFQKRIDALQSALEAAQDAAQRAANATLSFEQDKGAAARQHEQNMQELEKLQTENCGWLSDAIPERLRDIIAGRAGSGCD